MNIQCFFMWQRCSSHHDGGYSKHIEGIHGLGVMEEPNNKATDKDSAEGDLNKRKGDMLDEYQVDNQGFC